MNGRELFPKIFGLTLAVFLLVGCSGSLADPTATATPVPPSTTPSPLPPTTTPTPEPVACTLECTVVKTKLETERDVNIYSITGMVISGSDEFEIDGLQADLTCELGQASQQGDRSTKGGAEAITVSIDEARTYEGTQRTYRIVGEVTYDRSSFEITDYNLTVSDGIFGEDSQTCRNP